MNALVSAPQEPLPSHRPSGPLLRTLVLCDLADSTALIERLGDQGAATLIRKHDRLARDLVQRHVGQEIDKTDGFLVLFERPIQGVAFALDYQQELQHLGKAENLDLRARVGVHVGDVVVWENSAADVAHGAKHVEVEGLVKPVAARLANLALPGQILVSGVAANLAQRAHRELGAKADSARWINHGRYLFKGVPEPLPVYEIGEPGIAPMQVPPWSSKAHREVPWWRRPATVAVEMTLLLGGLVASSWWALRPPAAIAFANRDWVVVGDLKNLTGSPSFDDAVETAFRLGLEQSRHVNVLSDLKVRETIGLMQRDPNVTPIDRVIGSEVALRDGARALILPTIAEIGGRVRITAEVIDPQSQVTVYSESVEGNGANSVLPSIDQINARLRERLGETLATVSKDSKPLEKAATKSLEALKAYSLAQTAYDANKNDDALGLYRHALRLDPEFALARLGEARTLYQQGRLPDALEELRLVVKAKEHISPRDMLYAEAWVATIEGPQRVAFEKWRLLANLYPDFFSGRAICAYFSWILENRFDAQTVATAKSATVEQAPNTLNTIQLLASLSLGNERFDEARSYYTSMEKAGRHRTSEFATVYAAQRQFGQADEVARRNKPYGDADYDISSRTAEAAIAVDRGDWSEAWKILALARKEASGLYVRRELEFRVTELSLRHLSGTGASVEEFKDHATAALRELADAAPANRTELQTYALFAAYFLAQRGEARFVTDMLDRLGPEPSSGGYPMLGKLLTIVQAETARVAQDPEHAVRLLTPVLDGSEPVLAHAVLLDAYYAAGDKAAALEQARWLAVHRGRAYAEYSVKAVIPYDVAQTNVALLRQAEISAAAGRKEEARNALNAFLSAWPGSSEVPAFAGRIKTTKTAAE